MTTGWKSFSHDWTAYQEQTRPVADYYQRTGRLISVNGDLPMDEVTEQIYRILEDHHA